MLVGTTRGDAKKGTTSANGGTAFPISRDGYHLTAAHCLRGRERSIQFVFRQAPDGSVACYFARVVWKSPKHDLALLHIAGCRPTQPFVLGDAAECAPGDAVYALGLAEKDLRPGAWASFSRGRVATVMPPAAGDGVAVTTIVHETPVWHGDSGGPLLNDAGRVIGIHSNGTFGGVNTDFLPSREALERIIAQDRRANRNRPPLVRAARG